MNVARMQRTTAVLLWVVALLWFATLAWDGQWLLATVGAAVLLNLQQIVLAVEFFVMLPLANRGDPTPRPGPWQLVRAWWRECVTAHDVFGWQQPFRSALHADTLDGPSANGRRAVVLVHGFMCNRGVWNRDLPALRASGVPHVALTLEPPFGPIDGYAGQIDTAIEHARRCTGLAPLLVCHSMGGLAARAWWQAHAPDAASRVHSVITIGSPHQGTVTANLARADNARQMRRGNPWLQALAQAEAADGRARHFTCFYSHCDNIVMPASTAMLPGADNRHVSGQPHVALVRDGDVWAEVMRRLRD
jgi:pimeloyl-ACP methyl ester carboxylesterase